MKEEKKTSTKKQLISVGTAVKGLINGFISYGFLIGFIFLIIFLIVTNSINNIEGTKNILILQYTIPAITSIIIFFLVRIICNLSTFDLFKKCKIDKKDISKVSSKMNLFYLIFIIFSLMVIIMNLTIKFKNQRIDLENTQNKYYETYEKDIADDLMIELFEEYSITKFHSIAYSIIIEFGIFLGIFSLIPLQKHLIEKYN